MTQIKVFCNKRVDTIEEEINSFLRANKANVLSLTATESVVGGDSWTTVYLLYFIEK